MKIAVDARPLSHPLTGIGRYTHNVLKNLFELGTHHQWYLYSDSPIEAELPLGPNIHIRTGNITSSLGSHLFSQLYFSAWSRIDNIDTFWSPRHHLPLMLPRSVKKIVTIHDVVWCRHPETMSKTGLLLEQLLMPRSLSIADHILSVSDFTKSELQQTLKTAPNKVTVTPLAPTPFTSKTDPKFTAALAEKSFFLFVGTLEPRKNLANLLKAFSLFVEEHPAISLVIAGKDGWGDQSIKDIVEKLNISHSVDILGYVSEEQLHALYQHGSALLMPSIYEGFGLPAIEALQYGKPVIAPTKSAITPALSPFVINTKEPSEQEILRAMRLLTEIKARPSQPKNTWRDCAIRTLRVITNTTD